MPSTKTIWGDSSAGKVPDDGATSLLTPHDSTIMKTIMHHAIDIIWFFILQAPPYMDNTIIHSIANIYKIFKKSSFLHRKIN